LRGSGGGSGSAGSNSTGGGDSSAPIDTSTPLPEELGDVPSGSEPADGAAADAPDILPDVPDDWAAAEVERAISAGYVTGSLASGYRKNITRAEFCEALGNVAVNKNAELYMTNLFAVIEEPSPFTDTDDANIMCLSAIGIVQGVGEGRFNPDGEITRQEAAVILKRAAVALGVDEVGAPVNFDDQSQIAAWAVDALGYIVDTGIMRGVGDNLFDPLGAYTRQQAYLTIIRLSDAVPTTVSPDEYIAAQTDDEG
jgi:hypothetical protein